MRRRTYPPPRQALVRPRRPILGVGAVRRLLSAFEQAEDSAAVMRTAAEQARQAGLGDAAAWCVVDGTVERVAASGSLAPLTNPPRLAPGWADGLAVRICGAPGRRDGVLAVAAPPAAGPAWEAGLDLLAEMASAALRRVERAREAASAADRISAERARVRALLDASPLIVAVRSGPGHVLELANDRYLDLAGRGRELFGRPGRETLPEVAAQGFFDILDRVYQTGQPYVGRAVRAVFQRPGELRDHEGFYDYTWQALRDVQGRITGTVMNAVDVTLQVHAQREAEAVRARFHDLVHSIDAIVWEADIGGAGFSFVSEWAERVLGYPLRRWFEPAFWEGILHPEDAPKAVSASRQALLAGRDHEHEYRVVAQDGRVVWFHDVVRVLRDANGTPRAVRGVMVDISARMHAERERDRANAQMLHTQKLESLGLLASGAAHDFNNLLAVILGNASLAHLLSDPGTPVARHLGDVIAAARRAEDLTRQLLAYAGKAPFRMERVDLGVQVREIARLLDSTLPKKVSLELHLAGEAPVRADPTQVQQVVMNLVMNAAEAVGDHAGRVIVTTSTREIGPRGDPQRPRLDPGTYAVLEVVDTGAGMPPEILERIFDPFFSTKGLGRGLGLSAVGGIIRAHRGDVRFESTPGQGTRCSVYLPLSQVEDAAPPREPARLAQGQGTLLVVDDEPEVRTTARLMLEYLGYQVIEAEDGPAALTLVETNAERLAGMLLDISMPVMDGEEVLDHVRRLLPHLPVVMSSGYNESTSVDALRERGPVEFLHKPYTIQELGARLRAVGCG